MTPLSGRLRRTLMFIAKILLALAVLILLFLEIPPATILDALISADRGRVLCAVLLIPVGLFLRIGRWHILLKAAQEPARWSDAAAAVMVGMAFSVVTPAELGDYVARSRMHKDAHHQKTVALTFIDKTVHTSLVLLFGFPPLVSMLVGPPVTEAAAIAAGCALVLIGALVWRPLLRSALLEKIAERFRVLGGLEALRSVSRRVILRIAGVGVFVLLTYVIQEYLLLNALSNVSFTQTWQGYWAGMSVRSVAPFFFADLGIREATHVYFFGKLGIEASVAVSASLLMFLINVLTPTVIGLLVFLRKGSRRT